MFPLTEDYTSKFTMGSFGQTSIPPNMAQPQSTNGAPMFTSPFAQPSPFGQPSFSACGRQAQFTPTGFLSTGLPSAGATPTPMSSKRKRSRDDASSDDEDYFPRTSAPSVASNDDWEFGEGMTLQRKDGQGRIIDDEQVAKQYHSPPKTIERPVVRDNKCKRLNLTTSSTTGFSAGNSPTRQSPIKDEPLLDVYSMNLGVGWNRMSDDADIQSAKRGWEKYIENHFPVTNAQILTKSSSLESYLVEASEGWFLFHEDLKQGRLVAKNLETTFRHLRSRPPVFDGEATFEATIQSVVATPALDMSVDEKLHIDNAAPYAASQEKRQAFLRTLGEGAGESLSGGFVANAEAHHNSIQNLINAHAQLADGQAPEVQEDDAMDMS